MLCAIKQDRQAELRPQVLEQVEHRRLDRDVERRHRLVGDQELGLERERARDADALPLTARELARVGVERARAEADEVEQLAAACVEPIVGDDLVHPQQLARAPGARSCAG